MFSDTVSLGTVSSVVWAQAAQPLYKIVMESDKTRFSGTLLWSFYFIFNFGLNYIQYNWGENLVCLQPSSKLLD